MGKSMEELVKLRDGVHYEHIKPHIVSIDSKLGMIVGFVGARTYAYLKNVPRMAGLPLALAASGAGYWIGKQLNDYRTLRNLRRDYETKLYIQQHPERFPEFFKEVKTYGEVIDYWIPKRTG